MGTLYLVATPIGNLEDITLRALRVLSEVSLIAAEDTRTTARLLARYEIDTPQTSYHEHSPPARIQALIEALRHGDVALVSEAGMPGISDPGYELVRRAIAEGVRVVPIPGPSALVSALAVSGLPCDSFIYLGFLPRKAARRRAVLAGLAAEPRTLVAFEVPHRLLASLRDALAELGERPVCIARELTKLHEEIWRGTLSGAVEHFESQEPRGEMTLVIGGAAEGGTARWSEEQVREALAQRMAAGLPRRAAAGEVARLAGWSRREVYRIDLPQ